MTRSAFNINFSDLKINIAQIEMVMGYKDGESQETISELTMKILREAESMCRVKAEYAVYPILKVNDIEKTIEVADQVFNVKKIVYGQLKRSDSVAVFLCTAGEEIGSRSREAMRAGDLLEGYIYDVVGSEIADAAADIMQNRLREELALEGKKITNRYSPGYCDWDVAEQHKLFQLLPDNFCGIRLNSSALMDPVKSVSGFIGIGTNVRYNEYTCGFCDMKDCIYRRVKNVSI
jgi:cobalamin-dependent methionine synthase I